MSWFNYYGLIIMAVIMIPNIVYAIKKKNEFADNYKYKAVNIAEQIGRYACFIFMIFNIPHTCFGYWFENALIVYLSVNGVLCFAYLASWMIFWNRSGKIKALALSILPSAVFLFSGILLANIPLIVSSVLFGVNHIFLSYKNSVS